MAFGRSRCAMVTGTDPLSVAKGVLAARWNFEQTRAVRFPDWDGEPVIETTHVDALGRYQAYGWCVLVPVDYVLEKQVSDG